MSKTADLQEIQEAMTVESDLLLQNKSAQGSTMDKDKDKDKKVSEYSLLEMKDKKVVE